MANQPGRFEPLRHRFDDKEYVVPLLMDEDRNPAYPVAATLLRAAEIIAPKLEATDANHVELHELVEKVGQLLAPETTDEGDDVDKYVIEGDNGVGSVVVGREEAVVSLRDRPKETVPAQIFFGMIYSWDKILAQRNRRATDQPLDA